MTGDCAIDESTIGPLGGVTSQRCRACWLKVCLQRYTIPDDARTDLTARNMLPKLAREPHVSLISGQFEEVF